MRPHLRSFSRFLPVQLLLLHLRKYQLLLVFWVVMFTTISGHFAKIFGAQALFLAPEYFGRISFSSMLILGFAMGVFVMAWHITTFIIHSKRMPFIGATRHSFLNYCINNSLLPGIFLLVYSVLAVRFQRQEEGLSLANALVLQVGFYGGFHLALFFSFAYFYRTGRDLLKRVVGGLANAANLKAVIPYDSLDQEFYIIRADTYLSAELRLEKIADLDTYHPRVLAIVLRRHHRNAVFATLVSLVFLLIAGSQMDSPVMRIPAGAGFLILFSVMVGLLGAFKYFLRSWELIGYALMALLLSWLAGRGSFDLRSRAHGLHYPKTADRPVYDYDHLLALTDSAHRDADYNTGLRQLEQWKARRPGKQTLVVVMVSGGGLRSAYWSYHCLRVADSLSNGALGNSTAMVTGASGGMIGAAWWRCGLEGTADSTKPLYYRNAANDDVVARDLLNPIVFSMAAVDFISPFNTFSIGGQRSRRDRGYAMEHQLEENTGGLLQRPVSFYRPHEQAGLLPQFIYSCTIIDDGRKLLIGAQPLSYLCRPERQIGQAKTGVDAVDFGALFARQGADQLRISTALRMNATFPFVLPVVKLPSEPEMNVMDAGMRDNFGTETSVRWLWTFREWLAANVGEVVVVQIRDTRAHEVFPPTAQNSLMAMLADPAAVITTKWEPFQSYTQGYLQDFLQSAMPVPTRFVTLQYEPEIPKKVAGLNFHLTTREKRDIRAALGLPDNRAAMDTLLAAMR